MSNSVELSLKDEISRREKELDRLREALRVISGGGAAPAKRGRKPGKKKSAGRGRGPRGPKTEEQKLKISQALKKAWARRKKVAPASE